MRMTRIFVVFSIILCGSGLAVGQTEWVDHPDNPVIEADDPGPWAPGGLWTNLVMSDGATHHMWFTGTTVDDNGWISFVAVGHATSSDGLAWTMDPANPVIPAGDPGDWDDAATGGGAVIHDGAEFKMWYTGWSGGFIGVGYATSPDGSTWTKYPGNPVMEHGPPGSWDDTWIQPTSVLVEDGTYRMWFHGRTDDNYTGQIGYAESSDGINWDKRPDPVLEPADYPGSVEASFLFPSVVFDGTTYHMWYVNDPVNMNTNVNYAYSSDGVEWTKHRGNPVHDMADESIFTGSVLADGDTWRMWFSHFGPFVGGTRDSRVSYATSDCCRSLSDWRFIPAAAVASGAQGAFYQTDVDVSNADDRAVEYEFSWLPRGEDNSEPVTSEVFTLDAGMSSRYANVLAEVFDLEPDSLGALLIKSTSPDLLAMSRTYNLGTEESGGTYGQAMPAIGPDEFIGQNETRRILFGSENADMRTNIGCQNGGLDSVAVFMELFNSEGTSLGRPFVVLSALGNDQVNRIFDGHNPVDGYVEVSSPSPGGSFYCYGSVLDNVTSDPTTIPPQ